MTPDLPPGRALELPGRGTTFVREVAGPPGAPTLLLLHGWTATADLNWFPSYAPLGRLFNVVAIDHRGHGRGLRTRDRFRLADCADDAAAAVRRLGHDRVIPVGYSMGGPIAQLLWHRHRDLVAGLVLCATTDHFGIGRHGTRLDSLGWVARRTPAPVLRGLGARVLGSRILDEGPLGPLAPWARSEARRADPRLVLEAGSALGRYDARRWIGTVDVPTAVVVTEADQLVAPSRQARMAAAIPGATTFRVQGDHTVCSTYPNRFVPVLVEACRSVARLGAATST